MINQGERERALRVLHCPTTTGGHPQGLAQAERRRGLQSTAVAFTQNYLGYKSDRFLYDEHETKILQQLKCWRFLLTEVKRFDVIHYNAGTPILPWGFSAKWVNKKSSGIFFNQYCRLCAAIENKLIKAKVIAVTFQGDDARQGDRCLKEYDLSIAHTAYGTYYTPEQDELNRVRVQSFSRIANLIYALNPDLLRVLPSKAKFLPYAHLDPKNWECCAKAPGSKPVVVHAPSNRSAKGTQQIIDAIARLRSEGIQCELKLVENTSNTEAMGLYKQADLIIDQLLAGWYGGFAVEAMALGKPVVCYIREEDLKFVPAQLADELPLINAKPDSIYSVLKEWLSARKNDLPHRGGMSREFVEKWHDPDIISRSVTNDYLNVFQSKAAETRKAA
jgi:glycosyltransferase involved in cell wall biosynthesis